MWVAVLDNLIGSDTEFHVKHRKMGILMLDGRHVGMGTLNNMGKEI